MVNNDDLVRVGAGYPDHPHRDAEIVTWVLSGSLVHEDSRGNSGLIYPGLAQRMSAGSGIVHAERNDAYRIDPTRPAEPVHFIQMWIRPDEAGAPPSYQQRELAFGDLACGWVPIASGRHPDAVVSLGSAGSTLWVSVLPAGTSRSLPDGDLLHVYLARGVVDVEAIGQLETGDSLRVSGSSSAKALSTYRSGSVGVANGSEQGDRHDHAPSRPCPNSRWFRLLRRTWNSSRPERPRLPR